MLLDRQRTLQGAVAAVAEAAKGGAKLIVFPEAAREGCCWVVGAGFALQANDVPEAVPEKSRLFPDAAEWINPGDSLVVEPRGKIAAGPLSRESGILYADVDVSRCGVARRSLDVAGHYARPDVFELRVNRRPRDPIAFD